ncbi:Golgi reassembly stacking protein [Trypanosoma cruzi marinkellei]|uniref:Golgi reassembly stacking protein n=1 Tax=Trypanosoma cruzi marinkellei TaxID=85056 RepID=K2M4U9_TRYCR|nr:Golgi reassembly stacking protein [Trypanosoma cruzi marinkellei]
MGQEGSRVKETLKGICGLQVARVLPRSPAHNVGLVPFFDIITAVDDCLLVDEDVAVMQFRSFVAQRKNSQLVLKVYNLHVRAYRELVCFPSTSWGGAGLLGCSIEWCRAKDCIKRSWHVVGILPGSPAAHCEELLAERDFIIGMQRPEEPVVTLMKDEDDFYGRVDLWRSLQRVAIQRLKRNSRALPAGDDGRAASSSDIGRLLLLVYNALENEVKEVVLDVGPDVDAPLGINLAAGLLHSLIPSSPVEDHTSVSGSNGGTNDNRNDNGSGRAKNRRVSLPVMTTFLTSLGVVERCLPATPLQTPSRTNIGMHPDDEVPDPVSTMPPTPTPYRTPAPPDFHEITMPSSKPLIGIEGMLQRQDCLATPGDMDNSSAPPAAREVELRELLIPSFLHLDHMTMPTNSQGCLTNTVCSGVERLTNPCTVPQEAASNAPPSVIKENGNKTLQPPAQQGEQHVGTNASGMQLHGPVAHGALWNTFLSTNKIVNSPPQSTLPKIPPPLHFPIIRPTTPTR